MRVGWCPYAIILVLLLYIIPITAGVLPHAKEQLEQVRRDLVIWNKQALKKSVRVQSDLMVAGKDTNMEKTKLNMNMKLKRPECTPCRSSEVCESALCYFGRCVANTSGRMEQSVKMCFLGFDASVRAKKKEECAYCKKSTECNSGLCYHHKCVYGGPIKHLSILTCFDDSYIEGCAR